MSLRNRAVSAVNRVLGARIGLRLVRDRQLYPWQIDPRASELTMALSGAGPSAGDCRLAELEARYLKCDPKVTTPLVWVDDIVTEQDVAFYRGDTQYVWQRGGINADDLAYVLSYYYLKGSSAGDLLARMSEDGAFGARTIPIDGRLMSRDLLDSVGEIDFLRRHVGVGSRPLSILDIGAGYGRLAHRLTETAGATTKVYATDAFARSTFLCEHYLAHRKSAAKTVPLDQVEAILGSAKIDLATNVHSFSECRVEAIEWWVGRLARAGVRYLMVIPNTMGTDDQPSCRTNDGQDMESIFARVGYVPIVREPRYRDGFLQRYGLDAAYLNLFELNPA